MRSEDLLGVASRRAIFECVSAHPGTHLRDLARRCSLPLGTALYHLDTLEANALVAARRDGRYKRYFAANALGRHEKDILSMLRHETPRRIVQELLSCGPRTQRELCQALDLSRSTLSFHTTALVAQGVLDRVETRPERSYAVREPETTALLMERYRASLEHAPDVGPLRVSPAEALA
jgi:predicted transcriptional regulator